MKIDTKTTIEQVLKDHKLFIQTEGLEGSSANLSCADLSCADLRSAYLSDADLRSANLSSANLRFANLSYANLRSANLSSAYLSYADLSCADLSFANLSSANLRFANLSYANLRSANLSSANLPKGMYIFKGSKHQGIAVAGMIRIGCEYHKVSYWVDNYKEIGKKANYDKDEINDYGEFIKFYARKYK